MNRKFVVNPLPSKTWNWLNMNRTVLSLDTDNENDIHEKSPWGGIKTGMGEEIAGLFSGCTERLIEAKPNENIGETKIIRMNGSDTLRLYIHGRKNSLLRVGIIMNDDNIGDNGTPLSLQVKILAEDSARVDISVLQTLSPNTVCICDIGAVCEENSTVTLTKAELGCGKLYSGIRTNLLGDNSSFDCAVGYWGDGSRIADMNYIAEHRGKATESKMTADNVLMENSQKLFRGTIDFKQGCNGSRGYENESVLMLGENVISRSVPLILCGEENVDGNHGSTMGEIDEKGLFYLTSRGIPREAAIFMIARSRIDNVLSRIESEDIRNLGKLFLDKLQSAERSV